MKILEKKNIENINTKKEIKISLDCFEIDDINGSLDEVIAMFETCKDDKAGYTKYEVVSDANFYDGDGGYANVEVYGWRLETDAEVERRVNLYNRQELQKVLNEQASLEKEKILYKELKQKYEPIQ